MSRFFFILLFSFAFTMNAQTTLNGVTLPAELSFYDEALVLNGGGIRTKYFFKLYTIGLYLKNKSGDSKTIIKADETMAVRFEITSDMINSENMSDAINEGIDKSTGRKTSELRKRVDEMLKTFSSEAISKGDVFEIVYIPGLGAQISKNGKLESTIAGLDFKQAIFGIWLSDNPIQGNLKKGMLGK